MQLAISQAGSVTADTDASGQISTLHVTPNEGYEVRLRIDYLDVQFYDSGWVSKPRSYALPALVDPEKGLSVNFDGNAL